MTQNVRVGIIIAGVLLVALIFNHLKTLQNQNTTLAQELVELKNEAIHYKKLKTQWDDPARFERLKTTITAIQLPEKSSTKGPNEAWHYERLTPSQVDKIVHALFSSDCAITLFELQKTDQGVMLDVEVVR